MRRVVIWKPGLREGSQNELVNIGMGILARAVREAGDSVQFCLDGHFATDIDPNIVRWSKPDILAMSLASQEWLLPETQSALDVMHVNQIPVIVGGPHAFSYWDLIKEDPRITKIVVGQVDGRWSDVMDSNDKVISLDPPERLLTPDYSKFVGAGKMEAYPLYTSRGCDARCCFCAGSRNHGNFRIRSLDEIFMELESIPSLYPNVKKIYVVDDCFSGDIPHAKVFLHHWCMDGYRDKYQLQIINVRADQIDSDLLYQMKSARLNMLPIGVESGDPEVFRKIGKGETLEDIEEAIYHIQKVGITPWLNMIVGLPYDTPEHHQNSIEWCKKINQPRIVHWFQMSPFRATKAYDYFLKRGSIQNGYIPQPYGRTYSNMPWESDFGTSDFSAEERKRAHLEGYLKCYSPVLINSIDMVESLCKKWGLKKELSEWWEIAEPEKYLKTQRAEKEKKGQL